MRGFRATAGIVAVVVMLLSTMSMTIAATSTSPGIAAVGVSRVRDEATIGTSHRLAAQGSDPIEIHALDSLKFDQETITASPGQEIHVINDGVMQHDFVVDELGMATEILDKGEDQTIKVPDDAAPGEYTFYCSVPGHRESGMEGTLTIVEAASGEPPAPVPALTGEPLFSADGIDATILAQAGITSPNAGSTLLLELLDVAPDTELATHQTTSPELFYILAGVVTFQDNFGFASVVDAGRIVTLNAGSEYSISNQESEPGRLLRLRLAGGADATPGATPAAADGDGSAVLMQAPLDGIELEGARMYLARAQFGANADSGEQGHTGPLGIYVDSGTLNVVSPSGLVGAIEAGRAVSLPIETPLHASTGETEAVVFMAGVAGAEGAPFAEISSGSPITEPGTVLEAGQTWRTETTEMSVDFIQQDTSMIFNITYVNTSDATVEFHRAAGRVQVRDDQGGAWRVPSSDCPYRQNLEAGASITCAFTYYPPRNVKSGPKVISFMASSFGEIENATWQMEVNW